MSNERVHRTHAPRSKRILSLDGGGVKCLIALHVLDSIMKDVQRQSGVSRQPEPCEYFDLICGSEWGGILALMLGRLRMSILDCLRWFGKDQKLVQAGTEAYSHSVSNRLQTALSPVRFHLHRQRLFQTAFTELFRDLRDGLSEDSGFFQGDISEETTLENGSEQEKQACKTVILVIDDDTLRCVRLRSYSSHRDGWANIESPSILIAALATIAVTSEMPPISFNEKKLVSAYFGYINPSREAYDEATRIWSVDAIKTVVSLGCSKRPRVKETASTDLLGLNHALSAISHMGHLALDPERTTDELYRAARIAGFGCARFRGPQSLKEIDASNWEMVAHIEQKTKVYVELADIRSKVKACAQTLLTAVENIEGDGVDSETHPKPLFSSSPIPRNEDTDSNLNPRQDPDLGHLLTETARSLRSTISDRSYVASNILFDTTVSSNDLQCIHKADTLISAYRKSVKEIFTDRLDSNDKRIKIAILDTGVDCEHPYIAANWAQGEAANNYRNFYKDFTAASAVDTQPRDECGHGTHVAGIILRLAPYTELYVARVFREDDLREDSNIDTETAVCKAIEHAVKTWDVDVISMSFGFLKPSSKLRDALKLAYAKDIILLAAASNGGSNPKFPIAYPAAAIGLVICIKSADPWGGKSRFNPPLSVGDNFIILGENVRSTWPQDASRDGATQDPDGSWWKRASGTSVATPFAAAVAASILQYGLMNEAALGKENHRRLKCYNGVRQMFAIMCPDKRFRSSDGYDHIRPTTVLDPEECGFGGDTSIALGKYLEELQKC